MNRRLLLYAGGRGYTAEQQSYPAHFDLNTVKRRIFLMSFSTAV
jgi:hypothetical protein